MKTTMIPRLAVKRFHPRGMQSATDAEYARIATEVATAMAQLKIDDIPVEGIKQMALVITMYFEDVVADAGIWRGFTDMVKREQGRYLPFFSVDEAEYFQDEPNLDDVRFLVWYVMLEVHHGRVGNPESPVLDRLARAAYAVLERNFETVPVNEDLKAYFAEAQFAGDFYAQRDILKWFCFDCYLTYVPHLPELLLGQAQDMAARMQGDINMAFYLTECLMPYATKIGPLKLLPQEWVAATLRAAGNSEAAAVVGGQRFKEYRGYRILATGEDRSMTFEDITGETFTVSADGLNNPQDGCYDTRMIIASFVEYGGEWLLNGGSAWSGDIAPYEELRSDYERRDALRETYDRLKKESSLYYFADTAKLEEFLLENLPLADEVRKNFRLPQGEENIVLYIPADHHDDFQILPGAALCLKDERNPFYNQKMALNQSLNLALSLREEVRDYVIAHNLLPDATINSSQGLERGNEIVQDNFSFLVRAVSSRL